MPSEVYKQTRKISCKRCGNPTYTKGGATKYCAICRLLAYKENHLKARENRREDYLTYAHNYSQKRYKKKGASIKNDFKAKIRGYSYANFKKDDKCYFCNGKRNLNFHHQVYEYPPKEKNVLTICNSCHKKLHYQLELIQSQLSALREEIESLKRVNLIHAKEKIEIARELDALRGKVDVGKINDFLINTVHLDEPIRVAGSKVNNKNNAKEIVKDIAKDLAEYFEEVK